MSASIPSSGPMSAAHLPSPDDLAARLMDATLGAFDLFSVYLGDRLGFYRSLAAKGVVSVPRP